LKKLLFLFTFLLSLFLNLYLGYEFLFYTPTDQKQKKENNYENPQKQFGLVRKQSDAIINGAFLFSYLNKAYMVDINGQKLSEWVFNQEAQLQNAKLLKNNSILFTDLTTKSFKISNQKSKIIWEMDWEYGPKYGFHPHFWAIDNEENLFLPNGGTVECPDIKKYSQNKKVTWSFSIPSDFCSSNELFKNLLRGVSLRHIFYIPKFYLNGKPGLAIATTSHAFILDIETKKVLWKYKADNNEILVFKVSQDGRTAGIIEIKSQIARTSISQFDLEKDKSPQKWVDLASYHRRPDFFDLGDKHILFTDGDIRLFEFSLDELPQSRRVLWSLFLNFDSPFFRALGFDYIPTIPNFITK